MPLSDRLLLLHMVQSGALSPGRPEETEKARQRAEIISGILAKEDASAAFIVGGLRKLRDAGLLNTPIVLAYEAKSVVNDKGEPISETYQEILAANTQDNTRPVINIALIVREGDEAPKNAGQAAIVHWDGNRELSDIMRNEYKLADESGAIAIFLLDTGRGELKAVERDAIANKDTPQMPAYAILNSAARTEESQDQIGNLNLRNLLASIVFKGAFVGIGYKDNDARMAPFKDIYRFWKLFRNVGEAISRIFEAIKATATSV